MNLHQRIKVAQGRDSKKKDSAYGSARMRKDVYRRMSIAAREDGLKIVDLLSELAEHYLDTRSVL